MNQNHQVSYGHQYIYIKGTNLFTELDLECDFNSGVAKTQALVMAAKNKQLVRCELPTV
jgi:hypothetical protein